MFYHKTYQTDHSASQAEHRLAFMSNAPKNAPPKTLPPKGDEGKEAPPSTPKEVADKAKKAKESAAAQLKGLPPVPNGTEFKTKDKDGNDIIVTVRGSSQSGAETQSSTPGGQIMEEFNNLNSQLEKGDVPENKALQIFLKMVVLIIAMLRVKSGGTFDKPASTSGKPGEGKSKPAETKNVSPEAAIRKTLEGKNTQEREKILDKTITESKAKIATNEKSIKEINTKIDGLQEDKGKVIDSIKSVENELIDAQQVDKPDQKAIKTLKTKLEGLRNQSTKIQKAIDDQLVAKNKLEKENDTLRKTVEAAEEIKESNVTDLERIEKMEKTLEGILHAQVKIESNDGKRIMIISGITAETPKWAIDFLKEHDADGDKNNNSYSLDLTKSEDLSKRSPEEELKKQVAAIKEKREELVKTAQAYTGNESQVASGRLLEELNALVAKVDDRTDDAFVGEMLELGKEFDDKSSIKYDGGQEKFVFVEAPKTEEAKSTEKPIVNAEQTKGKIDVVKNKIAEALADDSVEGSPYESGIKDGGKIDSALQELNSIYIESGNDDDVMSIVTDESIEFTDQSTSNHYTLIYNGDKFDLQEEAKDDTPEKSNLEQLQGKITELQEGSRDDAQQVVNEINQILSDSGDEAASLLSEIPEVQFDWGQSQYKLVVDTDNNTVKMEDAV